ncbi:MAG: TonB-dependent receptor plug domain-containing protein [Candidatus Poribacteria bacterium]|nr:TonB-dependent receptor plug domain-containing protein [Candidatus Poribacteria bacterium]
MIPIIFIALMPLGTFAQTDDAPQSDPVEAAASDDVHKLEEIKVEAKRLDKTTRRTLDGAMLRRATGGAGDPFRAIARLPSVGTVNDFFGVLSVRGGAPGDNLYYFDRLPLGYPYHLLGIVSVVSPEVIGNIDVHPGGFGAQFGADSQAVIDIHSRPKNAKFLGQFDETLKPGFFRWLRSMTQFLVQRFDGTLKPTFIYHEAFLSGSFSFRGAPSKDSSDNKTNQKTARTDQEYLENRLSAGQGYWYAFGRRSSLEPFFELASRLVDLEDLVREVPNFWSYQLKGVYKFNDTHGVVLNAVTAYDASKLYLGSKEVHDSDLQGTWNSENPFDVQGIHFYSQLLPRFRSILSLTRSFTENELAFGKGYYYRTAASVYALRNDFTYTTASENTDVEFGYLLSSTPSTVTSHGARRPEEGDADYEFRIRHNFKTVNVTETRNLHRLEGYLQASQNLFSPNVLGTFGMRASYFNLTDNLSLQPRGQFRFILPWEASLYFSYGRYAQNPRLDQFVLGVTPNSSLEQSLATHYVLELRQTLPFGMNMNIAGYYKTLEDLVTYNKSERQYQNGQAGFVRGLEVSLGYKIPEVFDGWLAYAYTISKRQDISERFHRYYTYTSPHVLTAAASYSAPQRYLLSIPLIDAFDISAKWQYQSGVLYATLVGRTLYTNPRTKEKKWRPDYGEWKRTAPYHRLDLSLHFQLFGDLEGSGWELGLALEVWNVYNRNNILEVRYSPNFTKEEPISQLPIIPFVAIVLEF